MQSTPVDTSLCQSCGMPLAYDRMLVQFDGKAPGQGARCSYCSHPAHDPAFQRYDGEKAWLLDLILDVYQCEAAQRADLKPLVQKYLPPDSPRFAQVVELVKSVPQKQRQSEYDAIVLYSGGKDSSYMLLHLAKRPLRLCAWMLNQGYQSPAAIQNAQRLCERIGVPLVIDQPDKTKMDRLFRLGFDLTTQQDPALVRSVMTYGSACWPCFSTIITHATMFCSEHHIPFCFLGTQEGQNRYDLQGRPVLAGMGLASLQTVTDRFAKPFSDHAQQQCPEAADVLHMAACHTALVPFYEIIKKPAPEEQIALLKDVGWQMPNNTGTCSTNCMMNELGRQVMRQRFGFDLYQVMDAHERRLGNKGDHSPEIMTQPPLDQKSVQRAARMIKLTPVERKAYNLEEEAASARPQP
ncbi:MAG TPA: hypothetical protein VKR06_27240 [Ktedonosporobacter sp.]|nr:hypothetical protein [Ktedonosporobacter sp.]